LLPLVRALPAAFVIDLLPAYRVAGIDHPCPQLSQLVLRVLPFVVGRDPCVDRHTHGIAPVGEKGSVVASGQTPAKSALTTFGFGRGEIVPFFPYISGA
jgi:hypothetical protein